MNLLAEAAIVLAVIAAVVILGYLGVMLVRWQEWRSARNERQRCTKELEQLKNAHGSIVQAIELIEDSLSRQNDDPNRFQEKKLEEMRVALERNERKTKEAQSRLEKCQHRETVEARKLRRKQLRR